MVSDREDRKQRAQGQVCHTQGSPTEDHTKISLREDTNKTAQRQVSHRQGSSTENNRKISHREDGKEASQGLLSQGQGSSTEKKKMVSDREDGEETRQGELSQSEGSTTENNREIADIEDGKEKRQGEVSHREGSSTEDNTEEEAFKQKRGISVKEDNQIIPNRNKEEDRFNNYTTVPEDFRSSDTKEVPTYPGAMNYHSTSQSNVQMNPYGSNPSASLFPPTNMNTSTPVNEAGFPFMDSMMDNLFSENVMRNFSLQPAASGNPTSTTIGNANSILYGMDNYVNDVPHQGFHSTEECNIGNNIKIRISIDSKIPVEISQEQEQHAYMPSNSKPWQNDSTLTNSLHHGKDPSTDAKGIRGTSEIGINCKPYKINMKRHGKYSFTKTGDDKLPQVETPKQRKQERRDSLDSCCQTPSDWKEPTNYDINNLLQEPSTEKPTKNSRKNNSTSFALIDESRRIEDIQEKKWKQITAEDIKENQQQTQSIKWKKATNESIKDNDVISKCSERRPSMELSNKTFRRSGETQISRNRNDTFHKPKNQKSCNNRNNESATIKGASKRRVRRNHKTGNEDDNVTIDSTDDNDADDEEDEYANLQRNEETEEPSDEEEINQFTSDDKQFQETNKTDESNDDSDAESEEEEGKVVHEDPRHGKVQVQRDDEFAEEERYDQDQEEEEDDEGEDTESVKTYVKSIIPFDDDERNPHATSSPKGNITIMLHKIQSYCSTRIHSGRMCSVRNSNRSNRLTVTREQAQLP